MEFGSDRVFNSPIAEANIVGRDHRTATCAETGAPISVSTTGPSPMTRCAPGLRRSVALQHQFPRPAIGCGSSTVALTGARTYHSQCDEHLYRHISRPARRLSFSMRWMWPAGSRTAVRSPRPGAVLEHERLYRCNRRRDPYPGPDYMVPFGKAKIVQAGTDISVITYGAVVPRPRRRRRNWNASTA